MTLYIGNMIIIVVLLYFYRDLSLSCSIYWIVWCVEDGWIGRLGL